MAMRGDLRMRRHVQTNGVQAHLCGIAGEDRRPDPGNARCSGAGVVPRLRAYFARRQADLGRGSKGRCSEKNKQSSARRNVPCHDLPPFQFARKSRTSLLVASGFSSITQWPEAGTIPTVTFIAAKRISSAMALLK